MSLIIRRKPGQQDENSITLRAGPSPDNASMEIRVIKVDPDSTVHLAITGDSQISVLRTELLKQPPRDYAEE